MSGTAPAAATERYRPFRTAALAVYLVFSVGFSLLIIYSVMRSVLAMTPPGPTSGPEVYTAAQCVQGARALLEELEDTRRAFSEPPAGGADHRFLEFRVDWTNRKRRLESGCGLERPERRDLKATLAEMEDLVDLYTTASVQFSGSLGPAVDRVRAELEAQAP